MVSPDRVVRENLPTRGVLATKLNVPPARPNAVARPRLVERLKGSADNRFTLLSAPAGFGKTTLLTEWTVQTSGGLAWLSLDENDKDPVRFWSHVIAACQRVDPRIGKAAASLLRVQHSGQVPFDDVVACLVNEIISSVPAGDSIALILDDYHLVKSSVVDETLTFLLDHQPPQLHLVISSRVDPKFPLARLRARNQLVELRAADLRFTTEEMAEFLNRVFELNLSADQIATLEARTEGWIASLQLAALSMRQRQDRSGFIAAFAGSNRFILDYLVEEVLLQQPAEIQSFLLRTCVLERMCAPLCDALMKASSENSSGSPETPAGHADGPTDQLCRSSQQVLEQLERVNLFVVPLDDERRWYRYHSLFAEFLRHHVQGLDRSIMPNLYDQAARWCEENGLHGEAITYALHSHNYEFAADLMERHCLAMLSQGEFIVTHHWLRALPDELVRSRARLTLCFAWTLLLLGKGDAAESYMDKFDRVVETVSGEERRLMTGEATAIRAFVATQSGDAARTVDLCRRALEALPQDERELRSMLAFSLGNACLCAGDLTGADESLTLALSLGRHDSGDDFDISHYATACLAGMESIRGHLHHAAEYYSRALAREPDDSPDLSRAQLLVGYGDLQREWNNLDAARTLIDQGMALGRRSGNATVLINGHFSLARLLLAQGESEGAVQMVSEAEAIAGPGSAAPIIVLVPADRTRLYLAAGRLEAAVEWLGTRGEELRAEWKSRATRWSALTAALEFEFITLARVLVGVGRQQARPELLEEAIVFLDEFLSRTETEGRFGRAIELRILLSIMQAAQGDGPMAVRTLGRALEMAAPEGYVRLFVDEGELLRELLMDCRHEIKSHHDRAAERYVNLMAYVDKLLSAFEPAPTASLLLAVPKNQGPLLVETLSERERDILKLIVQGDSNQEIAQKLCLTVGTVKWHINHILSKLNARNRHHAAIRARELNLVD